MGKIAPKESVSPEIPNRPVAKKIPCTQCGNWVPVNMSLTGPADHPPCNGKNAAGYEI